MNTAKAIRRFDFYPLEDRVLLSGDSLEQSDAPSDTEPDGFALFLAELSADGEATGATEPTTEQPDDTAQSPNSVELSAPARIEVIFVDAAVSDGQGLLGDLPASTQDGQRIEWLVYHLVADQDGISQITSLLGGLSGVDAVHVVATGENGALQLGNITLNLDTAAGYAGDIATWSLALRSDADLLIYGSNLAATEDGRSLIEALATLCDCDVAASEDGTGHAGLGGDWQLEYAAGTIQSEIFVSSAVQDRWHGTLGSTGPELSSVVDVRQELVFIDSSLSNYTQLVDDLLLRQTSTHEYIVWILNSQSDGVAQISEALATYQNVAAVHIVSHGVATGSFKLGSTWLSLGNLDQYSDEIAAWSSSLHGDADLLIYGCDVAATADGHALLKALSELAGADVAASTDGTGHDALGANWNFEFTIGEIQTQLAFTDALQQSWLSVLATETVRDNFGAISYANNDGTQSWSTNWIETDSSGGGSSGGRIYVSGGMLYVRAGDLNDNAYREANLASTTGATLSFSYSSGLGGTATIHLQASSNGGTSYTTLAGGVFNATTNTGSGTISIDISSYASANTRIRFLVTGAETGAANNAFAVDNVQIAYQRAGLPVANDDAFVVSEDVPAIIGPLANDTASQGGTLSLLDYTTPANGTLVNNGNGTLTYTSSQDYNGLDSFAYMVNEAGSPLVHYWGLNGSATDAIGGANGVLNGTSTVNGDFGGALQFNGTSDYVLLPDISYSNDFTVSFSFMVDDNTGDYFQYFYAHGTVSSANSLNVLVGETASATPGQLRTIIRDGNDSDTPNALNVDISSLVGDGNWHTYTLVVKSGVGSEVYVNGVLRASAALGGDGINPAGNVHLGVRSDLEPNRFLDGAMDSLMIMNRGLTSQEVTALSNGSMVGVATIDVLPVNDAPVLDNSGTMTLTSISEDQTTNGGDTVASIIASAGGTRITDVDDGAVLGIAVTALSSGNGNWQYSLNGGANWTDIGAVSNTSALLLRGTDLLRLVPNGVSGTSADVTFRAWDQTSGTAGDKVDTSTNGGTTALSAATDTASITVTDVNDAPVISVGAGDSVSQTLAEGDSSLSTQGTVTVTDVDLPDTVQGSVTGLVVSGVTAGLQSSHASLLSMLSVTSNVIGNADTTAKLTWIFDSDSEHFDHLADGESLALVYTITVTDSPGATDTQDVTITITGTNDAPAMTLQSGDNDTVAVTANGATVTAADTLSIEDLDLSDAVTVAVTGFSKSGDLTGLSLSDAQLQAMFSLLSTGIDATSQQGTVAWQFDSDGETFGYLALGEALTLQYEITATDSQAVSDSHTISIVINGNNTAPWISTELGDSAEQTLAESDSPLAAAGTLTARDLNLSDVVIAEVSSVIVSGTTAGLGSDNNALLAMLSVDANVIDQNSTSGTLNWSFASGSEAFDYLAQGESLILTYTLSVTDSHGAAGTQEVTITVNGTNDVPLISLGAGDTDAVTIAENGSTIVSSGNLTVDDADLSNEVSAEVTGLAVSGYTTGFASSHAALLAMLSLNEAVLDGVSQSGKLYWTFASGSEVFAHLSTGNSVTLTYAIAVSDSDGGAASHQIVVTITGNNSAPSATSNTYSVRAGDSLLVASPGPLADDADPDGNPLSLVITAGPTSGTLIYSPTGSFTYTPNPGFFGVDKIQYGASDGRLLSNLVEIVINVTPPGASGGPSDGAVAAVPSGTGRAAGTDGTVGGFTQEEATAPITEHAAEDEHYEERTRDSADQLEIDGVRGRRMVADTAGVLVRVGRTADDWQVSSGYLPRLISVQNLQSRYMVMQMIRDELASAVTWGATTASPQDDGGFVYGLGSAIIGSSGATIGAVTAGYVFWAARGAALLATLATSMPAWRHLDPASLLADYRASRRGEPGDDELETMIAR